MIPERMSKNLWIFGTGYWANVLFPKINLVFGGSKFYIIDTIEESKTRFLANHPECVGANLDVFLANASPDDVCFVITPPDSHFELVDIALQKKCHCWVEKPLALNSSHASALIQKAKNNNVTLFVDNTFLFDPLINRIKEEFNNAENVNHIYSRRQGWGKVLANYGVLWDLLPHDLAIINNTFGQIKSFKILSNVYGPASKGLDKTILMCSLSFFTELGFKIQVDLSCISKAKVRQIQILSKDFLTTYELNSTGSSLIKEEWTSIPGNLLYNSSPSIKNENTDDSLVNALKHFKRLLVEHKFHPSLSYTLSEIVLIEEIEQAAIDLRHLNSH